MYLIIDGYNFLKRNSDNEIDVHTRHNFIAHLARYAKRKSHSVIVFFDGGAYQWPLTELIKGVRVIYSGERMSADECIQEHISTRANSQMLLVSSDRALNEWADHYGVHSLDSHHFAQFLYSRKEQAMSTKTQVVKLSSENNKELDELMKEAVPVVKQQEVQVLTEKKAPVSKRERAMIEILKRL